MLRWKFAKYVAAFWPLAVFLLSPFIEPLKRQLLNPYDVRWHVNRSGRTQTISVRNAGDTPLPEILVSLTLPPRSATGIVSDFDFGAFDSDPRSSLLDALAYFNFSSYVDKTDANRIQTVIDEHSKARALFAIDGAFETLLKAKLHYVRAPEKLIDSFEQKAEGHNLWLPKCNETKLTTLECQLENIREKWEYGRRTLRSDACKKWQETCRIELSSQGSDLSPNGKVYLAFPLGAYETRSLRIHYGPMAVSTANTQISSAIQRQTNLVCDKSDLDAAIWKFTWKYDRALTIASISAILICIWWAVVILKPIDVLPTYRIFNIALKTNDLGAWELAYKKHRYFLLQKYRTLCALFNKDIRMGAEELFDYVRDELRKEFKGNPSKYEDEEELNKFVTSRIRQLVIFS